MFLLFTTLKFVRETLYNNTICLFTCLKIEPVLPSFVPIRGNISDISLLQSWHNCGLWMFVVGWWLCIPCESCVHTLGALCCQSLRCLHKPACHMPGIHSVHGQEMRSQGEGNVGLEWHQALENSRAEKVILKNLLALSSFSMLESLFDLLFTWVCYFIH